MRQSDSTRHTSTFRVWSKCVHLCSLLIVLRSSGGILVHAHLASFFLSRGSSIEVTFCTLNSIQCVVRKTKESENPFILSCGRLYQLHARPGSAVPKTSRKMLCIFVIVRCFERHVGGLFVVGDFVNCYRWLHALQISGCTLFRKCAFRLVRVNVVNCWNILSIQRDLFGGCRSV